MVRLSAIFAITLRWGGLVSFPGPKMRRKDLDSAVRACAKRYTVRKFIIAAYGHARDSLDCTHPAANLKL